MIGKIFKTASNSAGESGGLNIFAQSTEPTIKEGLWINTSATGNLPAISEFEYECVEITKHDYYNNFSGDRYYLENSFAPIDIGSAIGVRLNEDIFFFGAGDGIDVIKYSPITDDYTEVHYMPNYHIRGCGTACNRKIYLFGGNSGKKVDLYDPTTDTYTNLNDFPVTLNDSRHIAITVGEYIYILLLGNSNTQSVYRYDPSNDTYTQLSDIPYNACGGKAVSIGTNIFIFGASNSLGWKKMYLYDTLTDVYTQLEDMPSYFSSGSAVVIGGIIHILDDLNGETWTFDFRTNSYSTKITIPYNIYGSKVINIGEDIYILGGARSSSRNIKSTTNIALKNKSIYIIHSSYINDVKLSANINIAVKTVYICQNGELKKYPAYYGDGTQWNLLPS